MTVLDLSSAVSEKIPYPAGGAQERWIQLDTVYIVLHTEPILGSEFVILIAPTKYCTLISTKGKKHTVLQCHNETVQ
jgi:hypothetical protein